MSGNRPNILMVMADSLRPDHLGFTGYPEARTPNLDLIATSGAFMSQNICPMPSSAPSRASIFTGLYPHSHGLRTNEFPLPPDSVTLAQVLSREGYETVAIPKLDRGCEKGFRRIVPMSQPPGGTEPGVSTDPSFHPTSLITKSALRWLEGSDSAPWFLWVDYESIHEPWMPPEPYRSKFDDGYRGPEVCRPRMYEPGYTEEQTRHVRAMYDGEVALVDDMLGSLLASLGDLGSIEETILVVAADHGVFLGEHHLFKKPPFLLDPLTRSTLIFSWPRQVVPGIRDTPTHTCDIMPTLLDLLGLPPVPSQGTSLAPVLSGDEPGRHRTVFSEFCEYRGTAARSARTKRWNYVFTRSVGDRPWSNDYSPGEIFRASGMEREMLFDLEVDPGEEVNMAVEEEGVCQKMRSSLMDWMVDTTSRPLPEAPGKP